ncbi:hypothetical protein Esti_001608 [Eimeria stiedai]
MGAASEDQGEAVMSLALLQNKIKRDPEAYREEFLLQLSSFQGLLGALKQQPQRPTRRLQSLAMFLAHTVPCYSAQAADSWASGGLQEAPQLPVFEGFASDVGGAPMGGPKEGASTPASQVKETIQELLSIPDLHPSTRHALLNATLLLRSKKMLSCEELLQQSLSLLCLKDKFVRQRLMGFVVKDVSRVFAGTTNNQARSLLLTRLFALLKNSPSPLPPRLALCCLLQVYRHLSTKRQTSNNSVATKLVNAVAAATLAGDGRLASSAALFLLGELQAAATQASHAIQADEEEDEEAVAAAAAAELQQTSTHACKKTLSAKRKLKKQKQRVQKRLVRKQQRAEQQREHLGTAASAAILDLLYDPHSLAERLFARVRQQRESFSTRVVFLNLLSRLVSHHKLLLLNIYPFMQRYLKPSQRLISPLLAICANLVHAAVPPQELMPLVKDIADNFANDTQGEEVLTVGLNAITEICSRNPLAMTAELLSDLLHYTKHKSSKSVSAAARGLLNLYRDVHPALLPKAFLGKEAAIQLQREKASNQENLLQHLLSTSCVSPLEFGAFHTSQNLSLLPQLEALKKRSREELERELGGGAEPDEEEETDGEETEEDGALDAEAETENESEEESGYEVKDDAGKETKADYEAETEEEPSGEEGGTDEETAEEVVLANEEQDASSGRDEEEPHTRKKRRVQASEPSAAAPAAADSAAAGEEAAAAAEETAAGDTDEGAGARLLTDADFAALKLLRAKQLVQQVRGGPRRGGGPQIDAERDLKLLRLLKASEEGTAEGAIDSDASDSSSGDSSDEDEQRNAQDAGFVSERDLEGLAGRKRRQARERNRIREEKLLKKKQGASAKWPQEQKDKKGSKPQHVKDRSKPLLMVQQSRRLREKRQLSVKEKAANLKKRIKNLKKSQVGKPRRRKR